MVTGEVLRQVLAAWPEDGTWRDVRAETGEVVFFDLSTGGVRVVDPRDGASTRASFEPIAANPYRLNYTMLSPRDLVVLYIPA